MCPPSSLPDAPAGGDDEPKSMRTGLFIAAFVIVGLSIGLGVGLGRSSAAVEPPLDSSTSAFPDPFDTQPTFSSTNGKLEVSLHMGVAGRNYGTPSLVSSRNLIEGNTFEGNVFGYKGCYAEGKGRCEDSTVTNMGGPTLRVKPGDQLIIHLYNDLPKETCSTTKNIGFWDAFHQPMNTNLHVHGLFVPFSENSVIETTYPGQMKTYAIQIRDVQQGGTHWYHPHAEGAVGIQAGGGAVGLLIVDDPEGDIPEEIAELPEITMRIIEIDYEYQHEEYAKGYVDLCKEVCSSTAEAKELCGCEPEECNEPIFGIPAYEGEYSSTLTVNGAENPTFDIYAGQWYRVRTVYAPTYKAPIEPTLGEGTGCDFKLLSKDGRYMPVTPRDIEVAYMYSGARADFLIRCNELGTHEFESIDIVPRPHNWATWNGTANSLLDEERFNGAYGQKLDAWVGTIATFNVVQAPEDAPLTNLDEIRPFQPARPCYLPDMRDLTPDDSFYFLQASMTPPAPDREGESYPVFRHQPSALSWGDLDNSERGNYNIMNDFVNEIDTAFPGRLKPPKGSPYCDGQITNDYGECYGKPPLAQDFTFQIGDIVEVDYYAPQIHPLHPHIFGFQITHLPEFDVMTDYFQVGDYHDTLIVPIAGDDDETQAEEPNYGKVVFRQHIYKMKTDIVVHCHFHKHSDRGMVAIGNTVGTEGAYSPQVEGTCYHGLDDGRDFVYV